MDAVRPKLNTRSVSVALVASAVLAASACIGSEVDNLTPRQVAVGPGDSILPMHVMLARFQRDAPETTELHDGATSREALVHAFVAAVEMGDSARVRRLAVSRAEYAHLYLPTSIYVAPPYELPPEIAWTLASAASDKGLSRVIQRLAGQTLAVRGHVCTDSATEGANRFWRSCHVDYVHPGEGRVQRRLFGTIVERSGRYKFLSYSNDF